MRSLQRCGFTLIELLVVVTIIVVLLALLVPSLDKALYAAELTVCGTRQKGVVNSVTTYALDFKRRFPYRDGVTRDGAQAYTCWPTAATAGTAASSSSSTCLWTSSTTR